MRIPALLRPPQGASRVERVCHVVALAACAFFAATLFWEAWGPLQGGHYSTTATFCISAENMLKFHFFGIENSYVAGTPSPSTYYCHHPYGMFLVDVVTSIIFRHGWFAARSGAIFLCW